MVSSMERDVYRRRCLQCADGSVLELPGVQHEALRGCAAVTCVAEDGMTNRCEVDADLMRPSGQDADVQQVAAGRVQLGRRRLAVDRRVDDALLDQRRRYARQ